MTRLIDADVVIKHIEEYWEMVKRGKPSRGMTAVMQSIKTIVNSLQTVDAEPHWIPCSERLPEDGVYLVYAPEYRGGSSRSKECHDGLLFSVCKNGKWSIEHGYYSRPNCVIAWMPLPKPFKVYKMR